MAKGGVRVHVYGDYDAKDIKRAIKDLEKLQTGGDTVGDRFKAMGDTVQKAGQKLSNVGAGLTVGLTAPILAGGAALLAFGKEAEEAAISNRKLGAVLESMGYPQATERVSDYAEQLERSLAVDADVIRATQTKLATFKNLTATVGEAGGAFDRATMAALDLAAAGFGQAETNAVQLGKALQDPVKGITALARAGVTFTEQEKEKIKALVESGDILAAQNLILSSIEGQVGGTAEAGASGFERIRLSLLQVGEAIGQAVLPLIEQFADYISNRFVPEILPRIEALVQKFTDLSPQVKTMIGVAAGAAAALGPLLIVVGQLTSAAGALIKALGGITLAGSLIAIKVVAVVAAVVAVALAFKAMYDRSEALRNAVSTLIGTVQNIARTLLGDVLGAFRGVTGQAGDLRSIFDRVATVAGTVLAGALRVLTGWWTILANGVRVVIKVYEVAFRVFTMTATVIRGLVIAAIDILFNKLGPVSAAFRSFANGVKSAFQTVATAVTAAFQNTAPALEKFINFAIDAVNGLIRAYNKLAGVLPGVTRATEIARFEFSSFGSAAKGASVGAVALGNDLSAQRYAAMQGTLTNESYTAALIAQGHSAKSVSGDIDGLGNSMTGAGGASDKATSKLEAFKAKFNEIAERLKKAREEIQAQYDGMAKSVTSAVMGSLDFGDALPQLDEEGNRVGGTFIERLNEQANKAVEFANRIRTLIQQGLSPEAITMVVQEGVNAGTKIADELIAGGATAIDETNRLVASTQGAATEIGTFAADAYYGTGLDLAKKTEEGFLARFGEGGPGYNKLNRMMTALANSLDRTSTITVVTRHISEGIPGRRMGGPVAAGSPYIVGEAGPELFVPTMPGRIIPNHDMRSSMTRTGGAGVSLGSAATTINLVVNAGMGTNGPEVGRQIVDALKAYERRNGPVYASA